MEVRYGGTAFQPHGLSQTGVTNGGDDCASTERSNAQQIPTSVETEWEIWPGKIAGRLESKGTGFPAMRFCPLLHPNCTIKPSSETGRAEISHRSLIAGRC